jgi:acetyl esterase/lipase
VRELGGFAADAFSFSGTLVRSHLAFRSLLVFLALSLLQAAAEPTTRNIPYSTDSAGTHKADLYEPSGPGPFPAIIYLHGGSWRSGGKGDFKRLATDLAAQGYVGFSIDYDLHSHSFPLSWEETRAAIRFVRAHAAEYHVDPGRIAIVGTSAGGEIAALAGLTFAGPTLPAPGNPPDAGPVPVSAAIILNGPFDLSPSIYVVRRYIGGSCSTRQAVCDNASPLRQVHPGAPPFFVGHGDRDGLVPFSQAQIFVAALQAAHDPVTPFIAHGAGHMYWTKKHFYQQNLAAMETFLAASLSQPTNQPQKSSQ